jgi:hypothetical protein
MCQLTWKRVTCTAMVAGTHGDKIVAEVGNSEVEWWEPHLLCRTVSKTAWNHVGGGWFWKPPRGGGAQGIKSP